MTSLRVKLRHDGGAAPLSLFPKSQTLVSAFAMSRKGAMSRRERVQQNLRLFDHLVGDGEQTGWKVRPRWRAFGPIAKTNCSGPRR
jgi:hypothetical protein